MTALKLTPFTSFFGIHSPVQLNSWSASPKKQERTAKEREERPWLNRPIAGKDTRYRRCRNYAQEWSVLRLQVIGSGIVAPSMKQIVSRNSCLDFLYRFNVRKQASNPPPKNPLPHDIEVPSKLRPVETNIRSYNFVIKDSQPYKNPNRRRCWIRRYMG